MANAVGTEHQPTQRCPRCTLDKTQADYHPGKWGTKGHYCRPCCKEVNTAWRRARGVQPQRVAAPPKPKVVKPLSNTYRATHARIARERGKAKAYPCAHRCGRQAQQWAYNHLDPHAITGPTAKGRMVRYSLDPMHYIPLCHRCHAIFDKRKPTRRSPRLYGHGGQPPPPHRTAQHW